MKRQAFNLEKAGKLLQTAAKMPPLIHKFDGQDFDAMKSEVIEWLCQQPEIRKKLFEWCNDHGAIVFKDGRWRGALHE